MQQGVENPDCISLAAGLVDMQTLPAAEVQAVANEILSDPVRARQALQYGTTQGSEPLREQVRLHLAALEGCTPDELGVDKRQIILTTGSQQLLSLICEVLFNPGDIALVAAPTYFVFLGNLNAVGARTIPIRSDEHGMVMEDLDAALAQLDAAGELDRVKLVYLVSYYENPSGISLSTEHRRAALEIVRRWSKRQRIYLLEDAAYRELRYDGPAEPSVWSFDPRKEFVILAQTFSKTFSPGLRVGYGIVPPELVAPLCDRKGNEDFGSPNFNQTLLARVMQQGLYTRHLERLQAAYRIKRDAMLAAAEKYFHDIPGTTWVHPHGGLYVWMSVDARIETGFESRLFHQASKIEGVMYVPGELCYAGPAESRCRNKMRLSFGVQAPAGIDEGMRRLARALRSVLEN
jgi:2-aminoadipate transaminase